MYTTASRLVMDRKPDAGEQATHFGRARLNHHAAITARCAQIAFIASMNSSP